LSNKNENGTIPKSEIFSELNKALVGDYLEKKKLATMLDL
jgi:hypothetical protein